MHTALAEYFSPDRFQGTRKKKTGMKGMKEERRWPLIKDERSYFEKVMTFTLVTEETDAKPALLLF